MGRLVRRYEFLEADLAVVAVLEDPSQEDIRSRAERMPLEDIINEDKIRYPTKIKTQF